MYIYAIRNSAFVHIPDSSYIAAAKVDSYEEAKNVIKLYGNILNYSREYAVCLEIEKDEFDQGQIKLPSTITDYMRVKNTNAGNIDIVKHYIIFDLYGLMDLRAAKLANGYYAVVDRFKGEGNFSVGDYVFCECDRKCYIVIKDPKDCVPKQYLYGSNKVWTGGSGFLPSEKYLHKVTDPITIDELGLDTLKTMYEAETKGDNDTVESCKKFIELHPWL